jgi:hypothetical protein
VSLVVNRRVVNRGRYKTPGRFATEVITRDVAPQLQIHYKSSKAKAYLKEGRALRVETTVNNADDFGVHKTLNAENWRALRRLGAEVNARFLAALGEGQPGLPDPATLESVVLPSIHDGQRAPGLRFGDPRTMALLASIASFAHVIGGPTNKALRNQMAVLYQPDYNPAQATYDLRRLRLKGFIERVPATNTYRITNHGLRMATFFTQLALHPARRPYRRARPHRPRPALPTPTTSTTPPHHCLAHLRTRTQQPAARQPSRSMTQKLASTFQNQGLKRG